jgi:hypothetical protein
MGRVVAINGAAPATSRNERAVAARGLTVGFAAPVAGGRGVVDNSANLHALDQKTGIVLWSHTLGTIGRAAPVFADGKLFLTEENGNVLIVEPGPSGAKTLHEEHITMPEGRHAEVWGSVAVAYGRLYFTAEDGLYCVGRKGAPFKATASAPPAREEPAPGRCAARADPRRPRRGDRPRGEPEVAFEAWVVRRQGPLPPQGDGDLVPRGPGRRDRADGRLTTRRRHHRGQGQGHGGRASRPPPEAASSARCPGASTSSRDRCRATGSGPGRARWTTSAAASGCTSQPWKRACSAPR